MNKNKTTYKLLQQLSDGRFHSGQKLGADLNITRSGVWKAMKQLQQLGLEVHAVTGKGYRLPDGLELLDEDKIRQNMTAVNLAEIDEFITFNALPSTNEHLLSLAKKKPQSKLVCIAEHQTAGRGRCGRSWVSSFGSNISLSLLWHFAKDPSEMIGLSLAVAIAIIRALNEYGIVDGLALKWPNDIHWQGRKLAGVLIDLCGETHGHTSAVIGVGLNVSMPREIGQSIDQPWVDIAEMVQSTPARNRLLALLLNHLVSAMNEFNHTGLASFIDQWNKNDQLRGKNVTLSTPNSQVHGVMQGISSKGELILLTENNETEYFISGELSLRLAQSV